FTTSVLIASGEVSIVACSRLTHANFTVRNRGVLISLNNFAVGHRAPVELTGIGCADLTGSEGVASRQCSVLTNSRFAHASLTIRNGRILVSLNRLAMRHGLTVKLAALWSTNLTNG